ncbi:cell wall-binding repeat-containing protein [Catenulispora yoronensis]
MNTGSGTLFGTLGESPSWVPLPAGAPLHPPTDGVVHPVVGPKVYRDAGGDRVQTGIAISKQRWTASGSAKAVVLATSLNFPDALSGGPLAAKKGGPLLLTDGSAGQLDPRVLAEIQRVLPHGGAVHVLGGDKAVNPSIVAQLKSLGYAVVQYKGADRADTALRVARDGMGSPQHVVVATGAGFADALAAAPTRQARSPTRRVRRVRSCSRTVPPWTRRPPRSSKARRSRPSAPRPAKPGRPR